MEILGALLQALVMVIGFAVWALPIVLALWILQRMSSMARDLTLLQRQLASIAEHTGAPVIPQPPPSRSRRTPLWAFGAVLLVFLILMGALYAAPGMSWRMESTELEQEPGSSTSQTMPMPMPGPVREEPTP